MSVDYLMIVPLFLAVAAGWWLGRSQSNASSRTDALNEQRLSREYFVGLDHLINEETDEAIESFIRALEINSDTIPAHLALAKLFRRKGEIDRAVGIHQRLLARPDLSNTDFIRIQTALARDYQALGLLDRAENLLRDIMRQRSEGEAAERAHYMLIKLYEQEQEWASALEVASQLKQQASTAVRAELAHYCCELALASRKKGDLDAAQRFLRDAAAQDPDCCRISLIRAELFMEQQQWRKAAKALQKVLEQDARFVPETIAPLEQCYAAMDKRDELEKYLRTCLDQAPSATVIIALAECINRRKDVLAAGQFLTDELRKRPSVKGFNRLIDLHIEYGSDSARQSLTVLRGLTGQLEQSKPRYQCGHCGFSGRLLHWQCPSCRQWGTTGPIQGLEGE